jgi:hypothetical protein
MKVPCYICDAPTEIDDILSHLRRHSDSETTDAYRKIARERGKKPAKDVAKKPMDTSVGTVVRKKSKEFVQLDETQEKVVE